MKKIVLSLIGLFVIAVVAGCLYSVAGNLKGSYGFGRKSLRGSGNLVTQTFVVGDFDAIAARNAASVQIVKGSGPVTVKADDNVMEHVEVIVKNGTLYVGFTEGNTDRRNVTLEVTVPSDGNLKSICASGAVKLSSEPVLTADEIEIKASGASKMAVLVNAKQCDIRVSGASKVEVGGAAEACEAKTSGASKLKLVLKTVTCELESSGASKIDAEGSSHNLIADASGASNISAEKFVVANCKASASSASKIGVNCTDQLNASASSAGNVSYVKSGSGALQTRVSSSSGGSVTER